MQVPDYAILLVISTLMFVSGGLAMLLTYATSSAQLAVEEKRRFAFLIGGYLFLWAAAAQAIAYTNVLVPRAEQTFPLLGVLVLGGTISGIVLLSVSRHATAVLQAIPLHWLATIQVYRIIGLVFLLLYADGLLSGYFALSTGWGDIFVGVTAPIVGYLLWRDVARFWAIGLAWCIIGIGDLLLVLYKAINSAPGPFQTTSFDLPTVIVGYYPFPLVPLLIVPISIILHVQLIRRLVSRSVPVTQ